MSVVVDSVPTDAHGDTNLVYLNPNDTRTIPKFTNINIGGIVYTVKLDDAIPHGKICMNLMQRRSSGVSNTAHDMIDLAKNTDPKVLPPPSAVLVQLTLEVSYTSSSKKGGSLTYDDAIQQWRSAYHGQYFTAGQQVLFVHGGGKYNVHVKEVQGAVQGSSEAISQGKLTPDTKIFLVSSEKSQIQVMGVPDFQSDAKQQQLVSNFDLENLGIGGLRTEFGEIFRRAFASRIFPQSIVKKLGVKHAKGVLLYGPPGTGKTLIARKIGQLLNCKEPKIINGPEVFNKFVGGTEENVRKLFADAEADQAMKGDQSQLHLIIFDEFDAICKQRGAVRDGTGVSDNVVNQLLSKIDGVNELNNVLLIGMTNRKDLIDEAILRPGRFEVHVEIGLPDEKGRVEILRIHTRNIRERKVLATDVDLDVIAHETKNFSGAELEGLVRAAQSHSFSRHIDFENPTETHDLEGVMVRMDDFHKALEDVKPMFGAAKDECESVIRNGVIDWGPEWRLLKAQMDRCIQQLAGSASLTSLSLLIDGEIGTGKSSIAATMALESEFPYAKFISSDTLVGYGEMQKCNIFRKAFEDAYKSKLSVIVLDDVERLVEYSNLGGRYSNVLLQTLLVLIKRPPPNGRKLLIIGTCSSRATLGSLELDDCFSAHLRAPLLPGTALGPIAKSLNMQWERMADLEGAENALKENPLPIKRVIFLLEMAAEQVGASEARMLSLKKFEEALGGL